MRKLILILIIVLLAVPAMAQQIKMDFPDLAERADEVVDITLDASLLRLGVKFLSDKDEDQRTVRELVKNLEGIYVRSYEFSHDNEYDRTLIDRVKSQLGPTWKPLVTVRSKRKDNVNIMADMRGDRVVGLVIIATEPREFTIVNIVGPIDIDKLASLEGEFGIPKWSKGKDRD
ncbi:MAG TPA: DUF4252 domain-containing protein [Thermoanaerobaculia bacterium]|nr:DUF4252 domain-containing protein [Thermoanaerobaculia bacterium]